MPPPTIRKSTTSGGQSIGRQSSDVILTAVAPTLAWNPSASTSRHPRARYTITLGDGVLDQPAALLDEARRAGAALRRLEPARLAASRRAARAARSTAEPILVPDGERFKQLQTVVARLRRAHPRQRRSRLDAHHLRRRRHRRHGRLRRGHATCAASRSSTCRRRCWRRWTARSAARSASTTRSART